MDDAPQHSPTALPAGLPRRLNLLKQHLSATDMFLDFEFGRAGPLDKLFPDEHEPLLQALDARFRVFAGDGAGGLLVLDLAGCDDLEDARVVHFSSEGGIAVLGESADDFLALVASKDQQWLEFHYGEADEKLKEWIKETGINPHPSAGGRILQLAPITREYRQEFWAAMREASRKLQPELKVEHKLVLGKQLGDVSLGMSRETLDERYGEPRIPSWGRGEQRTTANYPGTPFVIAFDNDTERVVEITMFAGLHRVIDKDGVELMFLQQEKAIA